MTTTTVPTTDRWYRLSTPARGAHAAGCATLIAGLAATAYVVSTGAVPSAGMARLFLVVAALAFAVGSAQERGYGAVAGIGIALLVGNYAVTTAATDHTFSHRTLIVQTLAVGAVLMAVAITNTIRGRESR